MLCAVKVFCGSQFTVQFSGEAGAWEERDGDGYWYYNDVLPAGEMTKELLAEITIPEDLKDSFNVVVIQECTQVLYKEDGTPLCRLEQDYRYDNGYWRRGE